MIIVVEFALGIIGITQILERISRENLVLINQGSNGLSTLKPRTSMAAAKHT
ncbi:hypothetical protein [Levyella massiliensis]|uniref:hypothetical protein n=1 Tax=Levyella massiliensis TaxID=938289 RepID=UPI003EBA22CF